MVDRVLDNTIGGKSRTDRERDLFVVNVYALLALLSLSVFGALQIAVENNPIVGALELAGAMAVALIIVGLRLTKNVALARACLISTILTFIVVMLTTGGTQGTGIFWVFMFPVAAFFLSGKRLGSYWMALLFVTIVTLWVLERTVHIPYYYSDIETRQLLVAVLVVGVGLYVYQRSREDWEMTARKSQQSLKQYLHRMTTLHQKVDHAKNEFMSLTSHQLRTPIAAIGWYSEMLLNGDVERLKPNQHEYVQRILDSNLRLGDIVDAMLMVSSLELGEVYVRPAPTDLASLTHSLFQTELHKFADRQFVIHETYADIPKLNLDPTVIKHVLRNLFSNALKYTPAKGAITIEITQNDQKLSPGSSGSVWIKVQDTGYGIPLEDQENTFAKLFRAANIKVKDTDGTGLGLYIVKALLDLVGGQVSFTSAENKGSIFVVQLPLEGMTPSKHVTKGTDQ